MATTQLFSAARGLARRRAVGTSVIKRRVVTESQARAQAPEASNEGWLFVDSVFPVKFGAWDVRSYLGLLQEDTLLDRLKEIFDSVHTHGFKVLKLEPRMKDGGVFARYSFQSSANEDALDDILRDLKSEGAKRGGFPSWLRMLHGNIWPVKGQPWREDLHRFASPMLKISFEGPDIREEELYDLLRPFGRIVDMTQPTPGPSGMLRSSVVTFRRVRSAATAHNCLHGLIINPSLSDAKTKLHTSFERPIKAHAIRDWITSHPRIVVPIVVFFLGTLTYTVFDPIRVFVVESKLLGRTDYRNYAIYKWIKRNTVERFSFSANSGRSDTLATETNVWKGMDDAETDVKSTLTDFPNTIVFIHGPRGSGKERIIKRVLDESPRTVLTIDCAKIYSASSDSAVLEALSHQTGYWPVFPFINSLNNVIDIASVGLIGQKAGLSTSIDVQVQQMLDVVGTALKGASSSKQKHLDDERKANEVHRALEVKKARRLNSILDGTWHDGRIDCVAGNGVMSELGFGEEAMRHEDADVSQPFVDAIKEGSDFAEKKGRTSEEQIPETIPVVVIKNFATKRGRDEILRVISSWAASLVNNQVAHVIVCSDNRENAKELAQALPSKPLHTVALSDADTSSALAYVMHKLNLGNEPTSFTVEQEKCIERLGGRASDLETLVYKVRSGQPVEEAVEDIITRGVSELQKNIFGEDADDAKNLPWTREQAWVVVKRLAKADEISYQEMLLDFPFKGDENALRNMEHSELITIGTKDGRPSVIRPGRPVYCQIFRRLVADPAFRASQDMAINDKQISSAEAVIRTCEDELLKLREIGTASSHWWSKRTPTAARAIYLTRKMQKAETLIERLEATNAELKKVLSQR